MEEATDLIRAAGHDDLADALDRDVLGGNPIPGMWSFQMVEAFDDGFYARAKGLHQRALDDLVEGPAPRLRGGDEGAAPHPGARATRPGRPPSRATRSTTTRLG